MIFHGRKIADRILDDVKNRVEKLKVKPTMAVIWVSDDFVTAKYIEAKERVAKKLGIHFELIKYPKNVKTADIKSKICELNNKVNGIMIQLPLPKQIDAKVLIEAIDKTKDVDALRFCSNLLSSFQPPTILAIYLAIAESEVEIQNKKVADIGKGFLVGSPLIRLLREKGVQVKIGDQSVPNIATITGDADVIISAVGKPGLIKPEMIKDGVVLIDAGIGEARGSLLGDIDPKAHAKASFYTPVPGGIGPVTVAMLFGNLVTAAERSRN